MVSSRRLDAGASRILECALGMTVPPAKTSPAFAQCRYRTLLLMLRLCDWRGGRWKFSCLIAGPKGGNGIPKTNSSERRTRFPGIRDASSSPYAHVFAYLFSTEHMEPCAPCHFYEVAWNGMQAYKVFIVC
jgi:hypothetical protein